MMFCTFHFSVTFRYEKPKKKQDTECKTIIERYKVHQQYEKAYMEMLSVDVVRTFLMNKNEQEQDLFRNHVNNILLKDCFLCTFNNFINTVLY